MAPFSYLYMTIGKTIALTMRMLTGKAMSLLFNMLSRYSCLENPMNGGALWAAVHGVAKSRTRLRDFIFTFHFHVLEQEMATHSSVLAWRIPGTAEPGGLPSVGSHRIRHDWSDLAAAAAGWPMGFPGSSAGKESAWKAGDPSSIPELGRFPGREDGTLHQYSFLEKPHEQRSLMGYSLWGHKEPDKHSAAQAEPLSSSCYQGPQG